MATDSSSVGTAAEAVARVAYAASDLIVSVQPKLSKPSAFSSFLRQPSNTQPSKEVRVVRENNEPLLDIVSSTGSQPVSVLASSSILLPSIPHLTDLSERPIVIHAVIGPAHDPDYSVVNALRDVGFMILLSTNVTESQDIAIAAELLARRTNTGVLHFLLPSELGQASPFTPLSIGTLAGLFRAEIPEFALSSIKAQVSGRVGEEPLSLEPVEISQAELTGDSSSSGTSPRSRSSDSHHGRTSSVSSAQSVEQEESTSSGAIEAVWKTLSTATARAYNSFQLHGSSSPETLILALGDTSELLIRALRSGSASQELQVTGILQVRVYSPFAGDALLRSIPSSVRRVAVLEHSQHHATKWGPLYLNTLSTLREEGGQFLRIPVVAFQLGFLQDATADQALRGIVQNLRLDVPIQNLLVGTVSPAASGQRVRSIPEAESAYSKLLAQVFQERLYVANQQEGSSHDLGEVADTPDFAFGSLLARHEQKIEYLDEVRRALRSDSFSTSAPSGYLTRWLKSAESSEEVPGLADEVIARLRTDGSPAANQLLSQLRFLLPESQWIVSSDAWSYDLGHSGLHNILVSGKDINMLIVDSTPYSQRVQANAVRRKKDIGLYAMNYGGAYVASVAVYSSYTGVLHAVTEAAAFKGPSIVLAYLPLLSEEDSPLKILQETKKAVDSGYWPLYRWHPGNEDREEQPSFQLDSNRLKRELEEFLKRDNHMTMLAKRQAALASTLTEDWKAAQLSTQKSKAAESYERMLDGLYGAPLTVLFASDNGSAEGLARRLANRGKARGLKTQVMAMDEYSLELLPSEENVALFTSVAGQGEFPQNGRQFWENLKSSTDLDLKTVSVAVFGCGDHLYWPRKGDELYYNKSSKDLDRRLNALGAQTLVELGLGDDQDPDGYNTAYNDWEPKLWTALGVDKVEGLLEETPPLTNEDIKIESNYLRGTIALGLRDTTTGAISASDQQLTKFHGTYMQDDRDLRDERKEQGLEPAYSFMIRCRLPGGVATPEQWLQMDRVSEAHGNETMKLTTRQTFQFHGVVKGKLRSAMQDINRALMTTIAACGDVNRNVMVSGIPERSQLHAETWAAAKTINDHLLPSTSAYHEIWLKDENDQKVQVAGDAVQDFEPLYRESYLPRKFKISIAIPPHNDVDVYAHDVGLIAIENESGRLEGFNVLAGGGMGVTHNNTKTYPRTGSMLGFYSASKVHLACEKIMLVQRDHGDRKDRKHARLKYTIDDMGVDVFKSKVEDLLVEAGEARFFLPKPFYFDSNVDTFGWRKDEKGMNHFTFFIENGRVEDTADYPMRTGLREIAKVHQGTLVLSANQHLILSNVSDEQKPQIKDLMRKYKLDNTKFTGMRLSSSACVAFPTCGLAMAESERYLPHLLTKLEDTLEENGLSQQSIVVRQTGCPNGCARPWLAEIGFVGRSYGVYNMYLGGGYHGQRLNKLYRSNVDEAAILKILKPMLRRYAQERENGEHFGDWTIRAGLIKPTTEGKTFHDDVHDDDDDEEEQQGK